MENVVLTVHLILALLLIGVVLLQRSEGGGLGMGGGGGGGVMTGRQAANALSKLTWILATGFLITSITLTIIAARNASGASVLDQLDIGTSAPASEDGTPAPLDYTPPPGVGQPVAPPAPDGEAAAPAAPAVEVPAAAGDAPADADATAPAAPAPAPATDGPVAPPAAN
ncbi:preprotein translocase subunit SecG [Paracoccus isoporae]|uniref:Protein-export membrane protein SecG n=1 Tax=Paracoccus isoporae TaxID=591205 RepID=A0A1G6T6R5_9RHOB|nr:preprotein translocase subunit SecG [Paracoccus isoporae]SDD24709.1 preprotein translocase subunit SecG [Paracoccus isoporae]